MKKEHSEYKCNFENCTSILNSKDSLKEHKMSHDLCCNTCSPVERFENKSSLVRHINEIHKKDKSEYYLCPFDICVENRNIKGFPRYDNMKDHVLRKHIKLCEVCWQAFNSDKAYSKHICRTG
jgi:hypothetical protein